MGTRSGWPDAQHVVRHDLTSHEIDNLIEEFLGYLLFTTPGLDLAGGAPFQTMRGEAAYHWSSSTAYAQILTMNERKMSPRA